MEIGHRIWAVAGGHIPLDSTGPEPACTSRDELAVLNCGDEDASVELLVYFPDREPVGPYSFTVGARRTRHVRVNDLIDPLPVPLDEEFALLLQSSVPVVISFYRRDTSRSRNSWLGLSAMGLDP